MKSKHGQHSLPRSEVSPSYYLNHNIDVVGKINK